MGVCDVRTLFRLCIDSSHAGKLHEACELSQIPHQWIQYRNVHVAKQKKNYFHLKDKESAAALS